MRSGRSSPPGWRAERRVRLVERRDGSYAHVLAVEQLQPCGERPRYEHGCERFPERRLVLVELALRELRSSDQLAKAREELRFERADGEAAAVCAAIDRVAREPAREDG